MVWSWRKGLSSRIYVAFLATALLPAAVAGVVGVYFSLDALKRETLQHLDREVANRADALQRFVAQLGAELLYLAESSGLRDLADAQGGGSSGVALRRLLDSDFEAFARLYPYIYQLRFIDATGQERIRVDRRGTQLYVTPEDELQSKADRYYTRDGLAMPPGQIYVSPLDLNVERGRVETPERPVVRFGTVVRRGERVQGLLIVNLHAEFVLDQMRQMAGTRGGTAYLFDRSGHYVARATEDIRGPFAMKPVGVGEPFAAEPLQRVLAGGRGTAQSGDFILAYAPVAAPGADAAQPQARLWSIALAYPEKKILAAAFNLYLLYGVLTSALLITAAGGFLLSRHLLQPLSQLQAETQAIAAGDFARRVAIKGDDEIADLGSSFNRMAATIEGMVRELEALVAARTAQLAFERQNLDTIIQHTVDGILAIDAAGRVQVANAAAARILGCAQSAVGGVCFATLWPEAAAVLAAAPAGGIDLRCRERPVRLVARQVGSGSAAQHIVLLRDMTEERRMEEERRMLDRQMFQTEKVATLGELAMGVAHEIGNPLAGMKTVVQALLAEDIGDAHLRTYLGRLEREIDRLAAFLHSFHGIAGALQANPAAVDLEPLLDDVLLWTRKEAKTHGVHIDYKREGAALPPLWADPGQLKQVLLNLVINAIHALPAGGRVSVSLRPAAGRADARVHIGVEDDGDGIAPEVLPRIFDPFFTTREAGTGLGLAIVKKIAVAHGADIRVDSEPGRGTRFDLLWPVAQTERAAAPENGSQA